MSAVPKADEARPGALRLARAKADGPGESIPAWLDVLVKLLRLPEAERASVREELEAHLSERVRDLMVTGLSEVEASGRAIAELGDMAGLAQRFNRAARPVARRRLMNLGMLAAAAMGLVAGTVAVTGPREDRVAVAVFAPEVTREASQAAGGKFDVPPDATWEKFFDEAGKAAGLTVVVNWGRLAEIGGGGPFERQSPATVTGRGLTLPGAIGMVNEGLETADDGLDYRVEGGRLEIASISYFDKREMVLATYDLAGIVEARLHDADPTARQIVTQRVAEEVSVLIRGLVHPELWRDNGGERASLAVFGTKLFVTAPKRIHPKIRWVLGELPTVEEEGGDGRAVSAGERARYRDLLAIDQRMKEIREELSEVSVGWHQLRREQREGDAKSPELARREQELTLGEEALKVELKALSGRRAGLANESRPGAGKMSVESFDRRVAALGARLNAARQEASELEQLRAKGFVSSSEAARRHAELMEEEADLLDRMAELETVRPAGAAILVEGGSVRPDGVVVDEQGRPADGVIVEGVPRMMVEGVPRMKVVPKKAAGSSAVDTAVFRPERMGPAAMREVLSAALNMVPELKQAPMRVLEVDESDGILKVTAPVGQLEKIGRIIRAMDLPGPAEGGDALVTTSFVLRSWDSGTVSELIGLAYHMRPGMEREFMGHAVLIDSARNAVVVTSRAGHVEFIEKFIAALDGE